MPALFSGQLLSGAVGTQPGIDPLAGKYDLIAAEADQKTAIGGTPAPVAQFSTKRLAAAAKINDIACFCHRFCRFWGNQKTVTLFDDCQNDAVFVLRIREYCTIG